MPNFHFTSVHCPDSKRCQLVLTLARTLRSYLDSCHRSTVHQHSIRCERASTPTHPLPNSNFAPCQLVTAGRTPSALPESRHRLRMQRVTRWAPHPRWHELPPPDLLPLLPDHLLPSRTGASHSSHQPALRRDPRTSFTASAPTLPASPA